MKRRLLFLLSVRHLRAVTAGIAFALWLSPGPALAEDILHFEWSPTAITGFVQVREGPPGGPGEGTRFSLRDLGLRNAQVLGFQFVTPLGEDWEALARLRYFRMVGSASFDHGVQFNGVNYAAGTTIRSSPLYFDLRGEFRRNLLTFRKDGHLKLLAGVDFKYLSFRTSGTIASVSYGNDKREDFYRQELPIPSIGLRGEFPIGRSLQLWAEAYGFRVLGVNSLRNEGGVVRLWQRDFESKAGLNWRLAPKWNLEGGIRYGHLYMNEVSDEDGNEILLLDKGLFVALQRLI